MFGRRDRLLRVLVAALLLVGLAACDCGDPEALRQRIAALEGDRTAASTELGEALQELKAALAAGESERAQADALANELVRVKVERDKLRQELAALRHARRSDLK